MTRQDIDTIISIICPNDEDFEKACISPAYLKNELEILALEQEPCTVDAKPIVHAHWIEGQTNNPNIHNILCSCCFEGFPSKGHANSQHTKKKFKWCPHCGAKMWEEEGEE